MFVYIGPSCRVGKHTVYITCTLHKINLLLVSLPPIKSIILLFIKFKKIEEYLFGFQLNSHSHRMRTILYNYVFSVFCLFKHFWFQARVMDQFNLRGFYYEFENQCSRISSVFYQFFTSFLYLTHTKKYLARAYI